MTTDTSTTFESKDELNENEIWDRRDKIIHAGFESSRAGLIDALPASGKSYGVVKWAAQTGNQLTVLAPRHDLLNEYEETCEKFGLTNERFPSFYRDCESFEENDDGEYEPVDDTAKELRDDYERGFNGATLHNLHANTPCQDDGACPFIEKRDFDHTEYDVLLGTYRHAHREKWIKGRHLAFDEFPEDAFLKTFESGIAPVVSAYLEYMEDKLPFYDYFDFVDRKGNLGVQESIEAWEDSLSPWPYDYKHARESPNPSAHPLAPLVILALLEMERLDNNWQYSDLGYGRVAVRNPNENEWTFHLPPDLSSAESIVGLDGTPNKSLWEIVLGEPMQLFHLLNEGERETYLKDVLEYDFVQTTEMWKPIQGKEGASPPKDLALTEGVIQEGGQELAFISSQKGIDQYEKQGLNELTETTEHYCNLKGMNDFGKERLGLVLGCPFPNDDVIQKWAALSGVSAERKVVNGKKVRGTDTDFGTFGNEVMHTLVHDEVLQAAMRFGREKEEGMRGATVYLHTSAIPPWLPVEKKIPDIQSWIRGKSGKRKTVEAILELNSWQDRDWKTTEVYPHVSGLTKHTVRNCLDYLAEEGYIEFQGKRGQGQPKHYANICLEDADRFGHVEFPE